MGRLRTILAEQLYQWSAVAERWGGSHVYHNASLSYTVTEQTGR